MIENVFQYGLLVGMRDRMQATIDGLRKAEAACDPDVVPPFFDRYHYYLKRVSDGQCAVLQSAIDDATVEITAWEAKHGPYPYPSDHQERPAT